MANVYDGRVPVEGQVVVKELVLRQLALHIGRAFPVTEFELARERMELVERYSDFTRALVYDLFLYVAGDKVETNVAYVKYPENWWEAFKARWFNDRMLKRWPVKYTEHRIVTQSIMRVCPHVGFERKDKHLRWMIGEVE